MRFFFSMRRVVLLIFAVGPHLFELNFSGVSRRHHRRAVSHLLAKNGIVTGAQAVVPAAEPLVSLLNATSQVI